MDIVSILITVAGIILMIALYIMSRVSQSKFPKEQDSSIPRINDDYGTLTSSVREDIPATDGSSPVVIEEVVTASNIPEKKRRQAVTPRQVVLFIAADEGKMLSGNKISEVLPQYHLKFGEMDLFHYPVEDNGVPSKLFSVANGVKPWTLNPEDLRDSETPGLSVMMQLPSPLDDRDAIEILVSTTQMIATDLGGSLKNSNQETFSRADYEALIDSLDQ
ncbi:MAG: hypothetical protein CSB47_08590 [Proteobacteria bacterium]|nr:MAG: hypothetical protein CSB47_08590 [Pseudomonadota bacterium]